MRHGYHDLCRPEILTLVPPGSKNILDLGCGTGTLGKAIKKRQNCTCHGVELNKEAALIADKNLDKLWNDNLNRFDPSFLNIKYDCMIFADILEHLVNPWGVLKKFADALAPNGTIVASLPNVAHPYIVSMLQKGLFRYEPSGILDITHLRFFTKTTISQMFYKAGLKITSMSASPTSKNPIQFLITATKIQVPPIPPIVTILLLSWNAWAYTKQCIESIKKNTNVPYKLLVIDNGSTDKTVRELRADPDIYHIENSCNQGFARGFNVGLACVDTPYFIISNTDVVVTPNWLKDMIEHIEIKKSLVCLGPMSNNVSGPQQEKNVPYHDEKTLNEYSKIRPKEAMSPVVTHKRVVFFCTLFKKAVLSTCGFLDELYELGNFEDDDYCMKINLAGLESGIDRNVFVHHYQSQTFKENKVDFTKTLETNKAKFLKKWNFSTINDYFNYLNGK